ncbi:MAG: hypothetical protein AB7H90_21060 [Alphaproteobacteria bacterium]
MGAIGKRHRFVAALLAAAAYGAALAADAAPQDCIKVPVVLWGDGRHDDTAALNAWLRGRDAIWADTGDPVGAAIGGRRFRLSSAIYVHAGTGRVLRDFRMEWPERGEVVTGGTIAAGDDPDSPPLQSGVTITGGDPGEGVPFEIPDDEAGQASRDASCAIS